MGFMNPFIPILLKRLGADPLHMGIALAAPYFSLVFAFPFYKYMSKFRALDIVCIPTFFTRLSIALVGLCSSPSQIVAIYLIAQIVEGLGVAAYARVLKDMYSDEGRSMAMGLVRAFIGLATIWGSIMGGIMIDEGRIFLPFLLAGICGAVSSLNFLTIFRRDCSPIFSGQAVKLADIKGTLSNSRGFFWLNAVVTLFGFGNLLVIGILPTLLVEKFDISNAALGILNSLTSIIQIFSNIGVGWFISRHGPQRGLLLGMTAGLANPWLFLLAPRLEYLAVPFAFNGIMSSGFDMSWMLLIISFAPKDEICKFASVYTLIMGLRGLLAMFSSNLALPLLGVNFFLVLAGIFTFTGLSLGIFERSRWETK